LTTDGEAEFAALVGRQAHFAFRVAFAVLLNSADAEDAVQETFLKLHRNRGWRDAANERAFVARVAWRAAVDLRRAARPTSFLQEAGGEAAIDPPSVEPGPDELLMGADLEALVHGLIDTLPEELRVPLVLSSTEEMNSREIAGVLGIPKGTVRTRLQRGREVLKQKLESMLNRRKEVHRARSERSR
jgi:RNA polymerase sigma-70 factor, ECF subfamily